MNRSLERVPQPPRIALLFVLSIIVASGLVLLVRQTYAAETVPLLVQTDEDNLVVNGLCSLREAVANANMNAATHPDCPAGQAGLDTITFDVTLSGGVIMLGGTPLVILDNLLIDGSTAPGIAINGAGLSRVVRVQVGVAVTLEGLIVEGGNSADSGAGIDNHGTLTVSNSIVRDNDSTFNNGGGIDNSGTLNIVNSLLHDNYAYDNGGALFNTGVLSITYATVYSNTTECGGCSPFGVGENGGGGLKNQGDAFISNSTFHDNVGGGFSSGGAVWNDGNLDVRNTTFADNVIVADSGGGLFNTEVATATLTNSTISGNSADYSGGGITNWGTMQLNNVTVAANVTGGHGGGLSTANNGTTIQNTIIAANVSVDGGLDCDGDVISLGYNLVEHIADCFFSGDLTGNITGQPALLDTLQDNGGPTATHALLAGSLAVDAGNPAGCTDGIVVLLTDQRGAIRPNPVSTRCDMGAFESAFVGGADLSIVKTVNATDMLPGNFLQYVIAYENVGAIPAVGVLITDVIPTGITDVAYSYSGATITPTGGTDYVWQVDDLLPGSGGTITVTGNAPLVTGSFTNTATINAQTADILPVNNTDSAIVNVCASALTVTTVTGNGAGSLSHALNTICPRGTVDFDPALAGATITLNGNHIDIVKSVTIDGSATPGLVISGATNSRIFRTQKGTEVTLASLTLTGGQANGNGGAVESFGRLRIINSLIHGNTATGEGGGVWTNGGLLIQTSVIQDNSANIGGAISIRKAPAIIRQSDVFSNTATTNGGGMYVYYGHLTIEDSAVRFNQAAAGGGAYANNSYELRIIRSTLSDNAAVAGGGGFRNYGFQNGELVTVYKSVIANNQATDGAGFENYAYGNTVTIVQSTVMSNTASGWGGGANNFFGMIIVENSTFSGNSASNGGGIRGDARIYNSTITQNDSTQPGGGVVAVDSFQNSIIAGNTVGGNPNHAQADCANGSVSLGFNVLGHCPAADIDDISVAPDDVFTMVIGSLGNNGGPTPTHALLSGSPAIDAGDPVGCSADNGALLIVDQRGHSRYTAASPRCDSGAYEAP